MAMATKYGHGECSHSKRAAAGLYVSLPIVSMPIVSMPIVSVAKVSVAIDSDWP